MNSKSPRHPWLTRRGLPANAREGSATIGLALDRYLEVADLAVSMRATHETYIGQVIRPVLGDVKLCELGWTAWTRSTPACGGAFPKLSRAGRGPSTAGLSQYSLSRSSNGLTADP